jgi:hypothetical protein
VSVLAVAGQNRIESLQTAVACEVPLAVQPEHVAPVPPQAHDSLSALMLVSTYPSNASRARDAAPLLNQTRSDTFLCR